MPADFQSKVVLFLLQAGYMALKLSPYVLGGIVLAALIGTFVPKERSFKFLSGRKSRFVLPIASVTGMISPACTYGTVPVFVEAIKRGASVGPAAAFLVASSLVNPQMSILAAGALGWRLAALQIAVAVIAALVVGFAVERASGRGVQVESAELTAARKTQDEPPMEHAHRMHSGHHHHHHKHHHGGDYRPSFREFCRRFVDLFEFVGFYFLIGTLIAAAVPFFIDMNSILALLGKGKWYAVPLGAVASVPVYMCGGGMIPLLAEGKAHGVHQGAILAFLIAGPATRITPLAALAVILKKRYVAMYVLFVVLLATAVGMLLGKSL